MAYYAAAHAPRATYAHVELLKKVPNNGMFQMVTLAGRDRGELSSGTPLGTDCFHYPRGIVVSNKGAVYVADRMNDRVVVLQWHEEEQDVRLSVLESRSMRRPDGLCLLPGHDNLLVTTTVGDHAIFNIDLNTGLTRHVAGFRAGYRDGPGAEAQFADPGGLLSLPDGDVLLADYRNGLIRRIALGSGEAGAVVSTYAGVLRRMDTVDGPLLSACFNGPRCICLSMDNSCAFVGEESNVRVIDLKRGMVRSLVRQRQGDANLSWVEGITCDIENNVICTSYWSNQIMKITPDGRLSVLAGVEVPAENQAFYGDGWGQQESFADGPALQASLRQPHGICMTDDGVLLIADYSFHRMRAMRIRWPMWTERTHRDSSPTVRLAIQTLLVLARAVDATGTRYSYAAQCVGLTCLPLEILFEIFGWLGAVPYRPTEEEIAAEAAQVEAFQARRMRALDLTSDHIDQDVDLQEFVEYIGDSSYSGES